MLDRALKTSLGLAPSPFQVFVITQIMGLLLLKNNALYDAAKISLIYLDSAHGFPQLLRKLQLLSAALDLVPIVALSQIGKIIWLCESPERKATDRAFEKSPATLEGSSF